MKPVILYYQSGSGLRLDQVKKAASQVSCDLRLIDRKDYLMPVGYLAGAPGVLGLGKPYDGPGLVADMMVLCGFTESRLDLVLSALRKNGVSGLHYKAVMTQTNQYWNGLALFEELRKEHELMHPDFDA